MRVELTKRFLIAARKRSADERSVIDAALTAMLQSFDQPHVHRGYSVRVLRRDVFELRASRALRLIFVCEGDVRRVDFVGSHDEVADYLRNSS